MSKLSSNLSRAQRKKIRAEQASAAKSNLIQPFYESTFFWGAFGTGLALLILGVSVTMVALVRWSLGLAWLFWSLSLWVAFQKMATKARRRRSALGSAIVAVVLFVIYPRPHHKLYDFTEEQLAKFTAALKGTVAPRTVRIGCPGFTEDICVVAGRFIEVFQRAGWKVENNEVQRAALSKPRKGVVVMARGVGKADPQNPDEGLWVKGAPDLLAIINAFSAIGVNIQRMADPQMPEGIIGVFFGPEP